MSEELKSICEKYRFDKEFNKMVEVMEHVYNSIKEQENNEDSLTMIDWILENTKIVIELNGLSEKEKFLFGLGVLMSEMEHY